MRLEPSLYKLFKIIEKDIVKQNMGVEFNMVKRRNNVKKQTFGTYFLLSYIEAIINIELVLDVEVHFLCSLP